MDSYRAINELRKHAGFFEVYEVTTFQAYRRTKAGGTQDVKIEILDAGPDADQERYMCIATSDDGKTAAGNSADSIDVAVAIVHWYKLDQ